MAQTALIVGAGAGLSASFAKVLAREGVKVGLAARTESKLADLAGEVIGCGEVAPLSRSVAEIRSLVIDAWHRRVGLGTYLVVALKRRARIDGYTTLCAFTHKPGSFVRQGFSIVPHQWLPEKIATDCHACHLFRRCGQYAMSFPLVRS